MAIMKNARDWFKAHPVSKVIYHHRWDAMSAASRGMLALPRTARVSGQRVIFGPHNSELSLKSDTDTSLVTPGGLLDIFDGNGRIIVTYAPVSGEATLKPE